MTTRAIDALDDVYPREHEFRFTNREQKLPQSVEQEHLLLHIGSRRSRTTEGKEDPELQRGNKTPNYRGE